MKNHEGQMHPSAKGFVQIPKILFYDPAYSQLTAEAKLLYGLLKDRSSLSVVQGDRWIDKYGDVFIYYTQAEIMERFNCGSDKARSMMRELENAGLVNRTRQGLCKPCKLVVKSVGQTAEIAVFLQRKSRNLDAGEIATNKYLDNNSNLSNTKCVYSKRTSPKAAVRELDADEKMAIQRMMRE